VTIEQMHERIQELEARLAKDSHNPSRPLSSDSPFTDIITLLGQANALSARPRPRTLRRCPTATASTCGPATTPSSSKPKPAILPVPAVPAPAGGSHNPRPATSFGGYASAVTRSCASSPTCAFPATTTTPNATFACPSSSRKPLAASAPIRYRCRGLWALLHLVWVAGHSDLTQVVMGSSDLTTNGEVGSWISLPATR